MQVCVCNNGKAVSGTDCENDGDSRCESCDSGFTLRADSMACDGRFRELGVTRRKGLRNIFIIFKVIILVDHVIELIN
jgi:hypothetical protein